MAKSPRKPRPGAEKACDHTTLKRRNGIELVMECGRCPSEPGLEGRKCFGNVLAAMQREGVPMAITLRSHVERRYGLEACASMGRITGILNKLDGLQAQLTRDSKKTETCAACVGPWAGKLAMISGKLRAMDLDSAVSSAWDLERGDFGSARSGCADCAGMTRVQLADVAKALRELEKVVARGAITITEAEP